MSSDRSIFLGKGEHPQSLSLRRANRHGLVAGATGTGKTVSLRVLTEGFSSEGVPVFLADIKGDLTGLREAGKPDAKLEERARLIGLQDYAYAGFPVVLWDLYGERGHPVRATVADMGPSLLSRMLGLNAVQEGVLEVVFAVSEDEGACTAGFEGPAGDAGARGGAIECAARPVRERQQTVGGGHTAATPRLGAAGGGADE